MLLRKNIPFGYVFGKIKYEILVVAIYSMAINIAYYQYNLKNISIPIAVPMILGTVLSLLLAFRSNQGYDRWWEARTIWGAIVNDSRSLSRQVLTLTATAYPSEELEHFRERFIKRQAAWTHSLGQSLRKTDPLKGLERLLTRRELNYVMKYDNVPAALLLLHGKDIKLALENEWINSYQQVALDATLTKLCDSMGKCERIKNTVFPATYSLYTHFTVLFFILLLPFALIDSLGFMEIPLVVAISASFLLIERMGISLQDPFEGKPTDTPMTTIARTIERDLRQMLHEQTQEEPQEEVLAERPTYYVL
ncbi:putative membrane protein [Chitinophaga jiangningensis]|uniref:Putative membrane protein n=1 Tax=Chitinophaga jiangningensis TaxID=1419482 RepID=A0A1M6VPT5_9BACT|nr:bestrophin family ion channel [Chitinophaga jiangningensis]SHK83510.1 putative membrane protein [Chitinophaga jiangningensis]